MFNNTMLSCVHFPFSPFVANHPAMQAVDVGHEAQDENETVTSKRDMAISEHKQFAEMGQNKGRVSRATECRAKGSMQEGAIVHRRDHLHASPPIVRRAYITGSDYETPPVADQYVSDAFAAVPITWRHSSRIFSVIFVILERRPLLNFPKVFQGRGSGVLLMIYHWCVGV